MKLKKIEEALRGYISEFDLKNLKTENPDEWNCLKKLAHPYENPNSFNEN